MAQVFFQGPHWGQSQGPRLLRGVAAVLKASWWSSSAMMSHVHRVGASWYRPQAQGRPPWLPVLRDGDSIPCSMTFALLAFRRGSLHSSPWKGASCSSLWTCALRVGGYGTRVFSRNSNCGFSQGPFLSRGMAVVLKASWRSSSVMMPHGIPVSAPDGAGIRPWSRHPDSQCLETAIRSRAP